MSSSTALIFDVDGTIFDPWVGFTRSIAYAFQQIGKPYDPRHDLRWFVGPTVRRCFEELLPDQPEDTIERAIEHYRSRFASVGISECRLYPGTRELLSDLSRTQPLFIATARLTWLTDVLLKHFEIDRFFKKAYGREDSGRFDDKAELLEYILESHALKAEECLMIGDRRHDVLAANSNGIRAIGVTWGYGTREELEAAGSWRIVRSIPELKELLLGTPLDPAISEP